MDPRKRQFQRLMAETLCGEEERQRPDTPSQTRILQFSAKKSPNAGESQQNGLKVINADCESEYETLNTDTFRHRCSTVPLNRLAARAKESPGTFRK